MTKTKGILIKGNTYPVREALKALGGQWDPIQQGWRVPESRVAEAKAIVRGGVSKGRNSPGVQAVRAAMRAQYGSESIVRGSAQYYASGQYDDES